MSFPLIEKLREHKWPIAIFLATALVRILYIYQKGANDPSFYFPMVDELWHLQWAQEILQTSFWGSEAYFRGPLYPYFLSLIVAITRGDLFFARAIQALLAGGTAVLLYKLGRENISQRVGAFAGFGYALYGTLIFYESMFLIPVLFLFLVVGASLYFMRFSRERLTRDLVKSGLLFGLSAIATPNILVTLPFLAWYAYRIMRPSGPAATAVGRGLWRVALFAISIAAPISIVTIRNLAVSGEFVPISTQGGINLYLGNNRDADGLTMRMEEVNLDESVSWSAFRSVTKKHAEKIEGRALTDAEESSFWTKRALQFMWHNPGEFLTLTAQKLVYFCIGFENSDNGDIYFNRNYSSIFSLTLWREPVRFPFGLIFPLAITGVLVAGMHLRRALLPILILIITYVPTVIFFLVTARHRLPIVPFLLLFSGVAVFFVFDAIREGGIALLKKLAIPVVALAVLVTVVNRNYFYAGFTNSAQIQMNLGIAFQQRGQWDKAEAAYREAIRHDSTSFVYWNAMGQLLMYRNRAEEAASCFQKSTQLNPRYSEARLNFGQLMLRIGMPERALEHFGRVLEIDAKDYRGYFNIGDCYMRLGKPDSALAAYEKAKQLSPEYSEVYFKLGQYYAQEKKYFEAQRNFERGAYFGEPSAIAWLNWGNVDFENDRTTEALRKYQHSLKKNPTLAQTWYSVGVCHYKLRTSSDSVRYYMGKALEINPNITQARDILRALGARPF